MNPLSTVVLIGATNAEKYVFFSDCANKEKLLVFAITTITTTTTTTTKCHDSHWTCVQSLQYMRKSVWVQFGFGWKGEGWFLSMLSVLVGHWDLC